MPGRDYYLEGSLCDLCMTNTALWGPYQLLTIPWASQWQVLKEAGFCVVGDYLKSLSKGLQHWGTAGPFPYSQRLPCISRAGKCPRGTVWLAGSALIFLSLVPVLGDSGSSLCTAGWPCHTVSRADTPPQSQRHGRRGWTRWPCPMAAQSSACDSVLWMGGG